MPSEKILEQKKQQVAELTEAFKKANVGVLVNYSGITVEKAVSYTHLDVYKRQLHFLAFDAFLNDNFFIFP